MLLFILQLTNYYQKKQYIFLIELIARFKLTFQLDFLVQIKNLQELLLTKKMKQGLDESQKILNRISKQVGTQYVHQEKLYCQAIKLLKFIEQKSKASILQAKELIFLVGPSGAGKTTLMTYISSKDGSLILSNDEGGLKCETESKWKIGDGKGSTTLFPNVWSSPFGNFIDCAGEGDTRGLLVDMINVITKKKLTANLKKLKILFIIKQASLTSDAGYGLVFKQAFKTSALFFKNLELFKNSMGFIVTGALANAKALESGKKCLDLLLEHKDTPSKELIGDILKKQKVITFSRPSDQLMAGDIYQPPASNKNQKQNIIDFIKNIPFTDIPKENFFEISASANMRIQMKKVQTILIKKIEYIIHEAIQGKSISIFAVEIKVFEKYLSGLLNHSTNILSFFEILSYNNYFKINIDKKLIKQINQHILFLSSFITEGNKQIKTNWCIGAKINAHLLKISQNVTEIISDKHENNFMKFKTVGLVTTKASFSESNKIKQDLDDLYELEEKKEQILALKKDQSSKYWQNQAQQVFSHYESCNKSKTVPVKSYEDVVVEVPRTGFSSFITLGFGTTTETRTRSITKYETVTEKVDKPVYRTIYIRVQNLDAFNQDMKECEDKIEKLIQKIKKLIQKAPNSQLGPNSKEAVFSSNDYEKKHLNLLQKWQKAEYHAYFDLNPTHDLLELSIETIEAKVNKLKTL